MPDNFDVLWIQQNLNKHATAKAVEAIQQTGRALPCSVTAVNGSLVTVKIEATAPCYTLAGEPSTVSFPPLTLPKAESQWLRAPVQVGDVGMVVPADTFLGGISGQGSGTANLATEYGNLTTLVWIPVAAVSFGVTPDANKAWVNGPNGSVVSDTEQTVVSVYDHTEQTVTHYANALGEEATVVETILNGATNTITHRLTNAAGTIYTLFDGSGNAISHVVPTGGILALGAVASSLASTRAVPAQADLNTLTNNIIGTSIQSLMSIMSAAMVTAGIPEAAAFQTIVTAANWIVDNIDFPTIPGCSSLVRVSL
jgi:hypothetical protein